MNTKTRLLYFIDFKSISKREFCKKSSLSHTIFNNNSAIGSDKLEKIHKAYEELNMDWVITGREEMIFNNKNNQLMNLTYGNALKLLISLYEPGFGKEDIANNMGIPVSQLTSEFQKKDINEAFIKNLKDKCGIDFFELMEIKDGQGLLSEERVNRLNRLYNIVIENKFNTDVLFVGSELGIQILNLDVAEKLLQKAVQNKKAKGEAI